MTKYYCKVPACNKLQRKHNLCRVHYLDLQEGREPTVVEREILHSTLHKSETGRPYKVGVNPTTGRKRRMCPMPDCTYYSRPGQDGCRIHTDDAEVVGVLYDMIDKVVLIESERQERVENRLKIQERDIERKQLDLAHAKKRKANQMVEDAHRAKKAAYHERRRIEQQINLDLDLNHHGHIPFVSESTNYKVDPSVYLNDTIARIRTESATHPDLFAVLESNRHLFPELTLMKDHRPSTKMTNATALADWWGVVRSNPDEAPSFAPVIRKLREESQRTLRVESQRYIEERAQATADRADRIKLFLGERFDRIYQSMLVDVGQNDSLQAAMNANMAPIDQLCKHLEEMCIRPKLLQDATKDLTRWWDNVVANNGHVHKRLELRFMSESSIKAQRQRQWINKRNRTGVQ